MYSYDMIREFLHGLKSWMWWA